MTEHPFENYSPEDARRITEAMLIDEPRIRKELLEAQALVGLEFSAMTDGTDTAGQGPSIFRAQAAGIETVIAKQHEQVALLREIADILERNQ